VRVVFMEDIDGQIGHSQRLVDLDIAQKLITSYPETW